MTAPTIPRMSGGFRAHAADSSTSAGLSRNEAGAAGPEERETLDPGSRWLGLLVLAGQGAQIDTTTAAGRLVFGIFAALADFERELIRERTMAGLKVARARGRKGGRKSRAIRATGRTAFH